ncbi:MAG: hypothetical protein U0169_02760 [Polyangiaceae bacterium]
MHSSHPFAAEQPTATSSTHVPYSAPWAIAQRPRTVPGNAAQVGNVAAYSHCASVWHDGGDAVSQGGAENGPTP